MSMTMRRKALALTSVAAAALAVLVGTPQPAAATTTRTITGSTTCVSGVVPFVPNVNWGSGWVPADSSYQIPGTETKVWTATIPASANSIALDMFCYSYKWDTFPYGTWQGWFYNISPGTSTITSTWRCDRHSVYPGQWIRLCDLTGASYG
jgi:hypothetical protein